MTTINNDQSLIEKVGGIKKARAIVGGAPVNINYRFYSMNVGNGNSGWHVDFRSDCIDMVDLRTAIAKHDTAWMEKRFRIKKWYPIHEHHMCSDKRTDDTTDHVTDIRNHVSPSTIVKDLEAERHG